MRSNQELHTIAFAGIARVAEARGIRVRRLLADELLLQMGSRSVNIVASGTGIGVWSCDGTLYGRIPYDDLEAMNGTQFVQWAEFILRGGFGGSPGLGVKVKNAVYEYGADVAVLLQELRIQDDTTADIIAAAFLKGQIAGLTPKAASSAEAKNLENANAT
jgi:hypothetical protein